MKRLIRLGKKIAGWAIRRSATTEKIFLFKKNALNAGHKKKALLSYIIEPFISGDSGVHQNRRQALILAKTISELGYTVDVVDYRCRKLKVRADYDLIIGFGEIFERIFLKQSKALKVFYATTPHFSQRNMAEAVRASRVYKAKGRTLSPVRLTQHPELLSVTCSDAILCTGNEWVHQTYAKYTPSPIYPINIAAPGKFTASDLSRTFTDGPKNFLWIGGDGLLLKGLDLCLEVLSMEEFSHINLHVCGTKEAEFMTVYSDECSSPNIILHGNVDVSSDKFMRIAEQCVYVIMPASSEAGCGAVLTAMKSGLVPIVTKESTISVESFGIAIEDGTVESVASAVRKSQKVDKDINKKMGSPGIQLCS
jgi:Glycosyl transferases group 1.